MNLKKKLVARGMKDRKMTQEEYNNLSPEEQNELFATDVLGLKYLEKQAHWYDGKKFACPRHAFDPRNNLDYAFMGVDKLGYDYQLHKDTWLIRDGKNYDFLLYTKKAPIGTEHLFRSGWQKTKNEAIILACLKAKGVIID